jgi:hypothetical protein
MWRCDANIEHCGSILISKMVSTWVNVVTDSLCVLGFMASSMATDFLLSLISYRKCSFVNFLSVFCIFEIWILSIESWLSPTLQASHARRYHGNKEAVPCL